MSAILSVAATELHFLLTEKGYQGEVTILTLSIAGITCLLSIIGFVYDAYSSIKRHKKDKYNRVHPHLH